MIKFFRHIRKSLLMENKTSKYFKYAIGEIILVMIGILLALQINNWNENRKQLAHGETLMVELMDEIIEDISTCNWAIKNLRESIKNQETLFKVKNLRRLDLDSMSHLLNMANIDIKIEANTFEKIKNQGLTQLTTNDSLNKNINEYFDRSVMSFNRRIDFFWRKYLKRDDYFNETNIVDFNTDMVEGFDKVSEELIQKQYFEFINLPKTKAYILGINYDAKSALKTIEDMKKESIKLVENIHQELFKTHPKIKPLPDFDAL